MKQPNQIGTAVFPVARNRASSSASHPSLAAAATTKRTTRSPARSKAIWAKNGYSRGGGWKYAEGSVHKRLEPNNRRKHMRTETKTGSSHFFPPRPKRSSAACEHASADFTTKPKPGEKPWHPNHSKPSPSSQAPLLEEKLQEIQRLQLHHR